MADVEFVKLPDGRYAAIVDINHVAGFTNGGNIRIAKTDGAGAQVAPGVFYGVNVWRKAEKQSKLVEVRDLLKND